MTLFPKLHLAAIGSLLAAAWLVSPALLVILAFSAHGLTPGQLILTAIFVAPYFWGTAWFAFRFFAQSPRASRPILAVLPLALVAWFFFWNFWPHHGDIPDDEDTPFDSIWEVVAQTMFGYPSPVIRIFDHPLDRYGSWVFDGASLLLNLWELSAALFFLFAAEALLLAALQKFRILPLRRSTT